jgi:hypothetical protein
VVHTVEVPFVVHGMHALDVAVARIVVARGARARAIGVTIPVLRLPAGASGAAAAAATTTTTTTARPSGRVPPAAHPTSIDGRGTLARLVLARAVALAVAVPVQIARGPLLRARGLAPALSGGLCGGLAPLPLTVGAHLGAPPQTVRIAPFAPDQSRQHILMPGIGIVLRGRGVKKKWRVLKF